MDDKNQTDDSTAQAVEPIEPKDEVTEEVTSEPVADAAVEEPQAETPKEPESPVAEAPVASSSEPAGTDQQGRQLYTVKCSTCGKDTQVPFQPTDGRPVYCRDDFMKMRNPQ